MRQQWMTVVDNRPLTENVYRMILSSKTGLSMRAGQFVNIRLDGLFLRRPISVCDCDRDRLTIIYKVVGKGTAQMATLLPGAKLDLLVGLGNGYDLSLAGDTPLLVGGGVGVPPLYLLAKELIKQKKTVSVILGFNTKKEIFYESEFRALGADVTVTTVDGSYGQKGFVTDAMGAISYSHIFTCGPEPMLKAVWRASQTDAQFSFEERMGCGFGACMGCSCRTVTGNIRICKEGPVIKKGVILWED